LNSSGLHWENALEDIDSIYEVIKMISYIGDGFGLVLHSNAKPILYNDTLLEILELTDTEIDSYFLDHYSDYQMRFIAHRIRMRSEQPFHCAYRGRRSCEHKLLKMSPKNFWFNRQWFQLVLVKYVELLPNNHL